MSLDSPISSIVDNAARITGIPVAEITGETRHRSAARARYAVIWAARAAHGAMGKRIGRALGNRDRSTIETGHCRAEALRHSSSEFLKLSDRLLELANQAVAKPHD